MCASVQDAWEYVQLTLYACCVSQSEGQYVRLRPGRMRMCSTHLYACYVSEGQYARLRPGRVGMCPTHLYACCVSQSEGQCVRLPLGHVGMNVLTHLYACQCYVSRSEGRMCASVQDAWECVQLTWYACYAT